VIESVSDEAEAFLRGQGYTVEELPGSPSRIYTLGDKA
jgi:hypothetical protein